MLLLGVIPGVVWLVPSLASSFYINVESVHMLSAFREGGFSPDISYIPQDLDSATHRFEQALYWDSRNGQAYKGLGRVFLMQHNYSKAVEALSKAVEICPQDVLAHFYLGNAYGQLGEENKAIEEWRSAATSDIPLVQLGKTYLDGDRPDKAIVLFQAAVELQSSASNYIYLANAYQR
jgi:tetratricopeptide (TPR) repeat protein